MKNISLSKFYTIKSSKRVLKKDWKTYGIPYYRGREVTKLSKYNKVNNDLFISNNHYESIIRKSGKPNEGDFLITAIGTIGNVYLVKKDEKFYFKDASILWGQKKEKINSEYVRYWFKSNLFFNQLSKDFGATVDSLTITKLKSLSISLPSNIYEQKRIVEKLDTCMEQINKAIKNVEQNIQNAEELFQSYLNKIFSQKGDEWETKKLSDVFDINPKKNTNLANGSLATYAPMKDLGFYYSKTGFNQEKSIDKMQKGLKFFIENDLLLAKVTPCFENGKLGVATNLVNGIGFGSTEYIVFRKKNKISTDYLFLFLSQNSFRLDGKKNMTGTSGLKRVPVDFIKNYIISYPLNSEEQNRIINLAHELKISINTIKSNNLVKLNALKDLKKSLLEKAFNGEL